MRLICPNCGAQYEVEASVIPEAGRDVQCSACGKVWFQPGAEALAAATVEPSLAPEPEDWEAPEEAEAEVWEAEPEPEPEPEAEPEPEPAEPEAAPSAEADAVDDAVSALLSEETPDEPAEDTEAPELTPAPVPGQTPRRALDDSLLAILREEAEREAAARRDEGTALVETQEEMNLEPLAARAASRAAAKLAESARPAAPAPAPVESEERYAELFEEEAGEDAQAHASRRERLPDIEEINSTLRATSDRAGEAAAIDAPQTRAERNRAGFRTGFSSVLALGCAAALLYVFSAQIGRLAPPLAPMLAGYSATVDQGRIWLDGQLRAAIEQMQDKPAN